MKTIFLTHGHANEKIIAHPENGSFVSVYCMYGKQGPDKLVLEGPHNRMHCAVLANALEDAGVDPLRIITINGGDADSALKHRAIAVNRIMEDLQLDPRDCLHIEPHLNAAGRASKWHKAEGHKIFHNGKFLAKTISKELDWALTKHKPYKSKSRGIARKYFGRVRCASILVEEYFQTNQSEVETYVLSNWATKNTSTLMSIHADVIVPFMRLQDGKE